MFFNLLRESGGFFEGIVEIEIVTLLQLVSAIRRKCARSPFLSFAFSRILDLHLLGGIIQIPCKRLSQLGALTRAAPRPSTGTLAIGIPRVWRICPPCLSVQTGVAIVARQRLLTMISRAGTVRIFCGIISLRFITAFHSFFFLFILMNIHHIAPSKFPVFEVCEKCFTELLLSTAISLNGTVSYRPLFAIHSLLIDINNFDDYSCAQHRV